MDRRLFMMLAAAGIADPGANPLPGVGPEPGLSAPAETVDGAPKSGSAAEFLPAFSHRGMAA